MSTKRTYTLAFILFVTFSLQLLALPAYAQTDQERIDELRKQIDQLEQEAQNYRQNIAGEQAQAQTLQKEISILKSQISQLETQIVLTGKKVQKTEIEITGLENDIFNTQEKIDTEKRTISQILLYLNRRDNQELLVTLIKNKDLSDFLRQGQYAQNMNASLLGLIGELKDTKADLEKNKTDLENKKTDLETLRQQQSAQKVSLSGVKTDKNSLLQTTKGEEAKYQRMLADVEKRQTAFFNELRQLETKIIAGGLYIVHITAQNAPKKGTKLFQYPESGYRITQSYGMTAYAKRGAYGGAPHNGIDFAAGSGTPISAIGDGEIVANGYNDGWGNWVAIKHVYDLVSVYGHMSYLSPLKVGTLVKVGDVIGYEGSTGNSTGSHVHLSIYKDFFTYIKNKNGQDQLYFNYFEGSINPMDYL